VKERQLPQSISCGKTFRGHTALKAFPAVHKWPGELGCELEERVAADRVDNERIPRLLTVRINPSVGLVQEGPDWSSAMPYPCWGMTEAA